MKLIALATSHNRRKLTLRSIKSILEQELPIGCELEICLVDDGSTDDTSSSIRNIYPSVKLLQGTGELFWAGGMRFGWEKYVKYQKFDYLLVFNDDIKIYQGAIKNLLNTAEELHKKAQTSFAVTGAFKESETGNLAYGGVIRASNWHPLRFKKIPPTDVIQACDTLNMNFVLIDKHALNSVGFLSKGFRHAGADYDFGLRLIKNGGYVYLAPGYIGECNTNNKIGTSEEPGISLRERWKRLTNIKEQAPRQRALYYRRHAGLFWPLLWILPYLRILFSRN